MTNLRNSIQKFFEAKEQKQILEKAKQRFEYKPFYLEYRGLFKTAYFGRWFFHAFSIATGLTLLALLINSGLNLFPLSLAFAGLLLAIWEAGKTQMLAKSFTAYYANEGKMPWGLLVLGALFLSASVFCSIEGAKSFYELNNTAGQELEVFHQSQTDSIRQEYGLQISAIDTRIAGIEANKPKRWGGLLSSSENKQILNYQIQIERLKQEQEKALKALTSIQQKEAQAFTEKTGFNTWGFAVLAGVNEALILLIAWFLIYYDYRTTQESEAITTPSISFDVPTIQKLLHMAVIDSGSEQLLINSLSDATKKSIGFKSQSLASTASENRKDSGETQDSSTATALTDLMTDISNGIRDFRYLMRKHRVNVLAVKEAIDLYNSYQETE